MPPKFEDERFHKLIEANEKCTDAGFNIRAYRCRSRSCGTQHCAAGNYVASNPGCGLVITGDSFILDTDTLDPAMSGMVALARHFGISFDEAMSLFTGSTYPSGWRAGRIEVITRLKQFYKDKTGRDYVAPPSPGPHLNKDQH